MDNNNINKMDNYFKFLSKNQKRWERKANFDYKEFYKTKTKKDMNSMQKYRMDQEDLKISRKPKEIQDPAKVWGYIISESTKFFNGDILDNTELNKCINVWIESDWIWDLRHPNLGISDCKKLQKYLNLEILKIEHNSVHVNEIPQGSMFGSVMIHYRITCTQIVYWDAIKKYFDK